MTDSSRLGLAVLSCAALAFAVHANALENGFAYDDVAVVEQNPAIGSLTNIPSFFRESYWGPERGGAATWLYRPVTMTTYALDWAVWGGHPFGFHLTNAWLHALVTALVALLLGRVLGTGAALAGAALFAVHPVHVEAVANVAGRAEALAALAYLSALLVYLSRTRVLESGGPGAGALFALALLYVLGTLSKETAITLPAALFLVDAARGDMRFREIGEYFRRRLPVYGALALGAVVALGARYVALGGVPLGDPAPAFLPDASFPTRLFTMITVWPHYVRLLVAPLDLSPDYSPEVILPETSLTPAALYGLGLAAAILALAALGWRRMPWVSAGPIWAAIALAPVSNLLFSSGVVLAERTLYLPSVGVSLVVAGLTEAISRRGLGTRFLWGLAIVGVTGVFALVAVRQNPVWASTNTVVDEVLRTHPNSYRGHWFHGNRLAWADRGAEARAHYGQALALWPHDERIWVDWAGHNLRWKRWDEAEAAARRAVELAPQKPGPRHMLASTLFEAGRLEAARAEALNGLAAVRDPAGLYRVLAEAYRGEKRYAEAARAFRAGLAPARWQDWVALAQLRAAAGDTASAFGTLDTARALAAREPAVHDSIAAVRQLLLRLR